MSEHKDAMTPGQVADMVTTLRDGFGADMSKPIQDYFIQSAPIAMSKATDMIETQAAEITALRAERDVAQAGWDDQKFRHKESFGKIYENLTRALDAEAERDALQQTQAYRYIGKDGKPILARDLEEQRDAALARVGVLEAALKPFAIEGFPSAVAAWDAISNDRIHDWVAFEDICDARAALVHKGADE